MGLIKEVFAEQFTSYPTTPSVKVHHPSIAKLYFTLCFTVIVAYLASIRFDFREIYQDSCPVHGIVLTKVKGHASTKQIPDAELNVESPHMYQRTWDAADVVIPVHGGEGETGSFGIVTNMIITANQTQGTCAVIPEPNAKTNCTQDSDCQEGHSSASTQGVLTGKCVVEKGACEVEGWCPPEAPKLPRNGKKPLLEGVQNFTFLLKSAVDFPGCGGQKGKNVRTDVPLKYLQTCTYDAEKYPLCPIFRIKDVVEWSGVEFNEAALKGAVFRINVKWECDFDWGKTVKDCLPTYEFSSVDESKPGSLTTYNFRSAQYYSDSQRTLRKMFALKILISMEGEGKMFDLFTFVTTVGATTGLFCVAPFACDIILTMYNFYCRKKEVIGEKDNEKSQPSEVVTSSTTTNGNSSMK